MAIKQIIKVMQSTISVYRGVQISWLCANPEGRKEGERCNYYIMAEIETREKGGMVLWYSRLNLKDERNVFL